MENFTPYSALAGGILIGLSASLLMLLNGRIAGISGMVRGLIMPESLAEFNWRLAFVIGMMIGGFGYVSFFPVSIALPDNINTGMLIIGGFLVGLGTSLGNGCTSGHGVCGLSRFSLRSLIATITFLTTAIVTVYLIRHVIGG